MLKVYYQFDLDSNEATETSAKGYCFVVGRGMLIFKSDLSRASHYPPGWVAFLNLLMFSSVTTVR